MAITGTTAIAPLFTPNTSAITERRTKVRPARMLLQLCVLLVLSVIPRAQVREAGRVQDQAVRPPAGPTGNPSAADSSPTRDSFSTRITGTRVALGPGDLLEITVFDTPELAQRTRVSS